MKEPLYTKFPTKRRPLAAALSAMALSCAAFAPAADAAMLSYESFSGYATGDISGQGPAVAGYSGNWTAVDFGTQHLLVSQTSLGYAGANYAGSTGGSLGAPVGGGGGGSGRVFRLLDSTLAVNSTTAGTLYLSFLYQNGSQTQTTFQDLSLYNTTTADANRTFTAGINSNGGSSGLAYNFGVNEAYTSTGVTSNSATHLFVVKFTLSATAASDSVTVWLDPTLGGAGDPAGGITVGGQNILFDRLAMDDYDDQNTVNYDEIRWGTTFGDVTVVPEPSTWMASLLGLGLLVSFTRRRRVNA